MLYHIKKFLYLISYINDIINFGVNNTKQNNISPDGDTMAGKTTTIKELLKAAMLPVGSTLYVYGGAWNEADTGAGEEAMTFGVSPEWKKFYDSKDETYDFDKFRFQVHEGIDCTGLVGFSCFQVFGSAYSETGYVFPSGIMAENYEKLFGGETVAPEDIKNYRPGDVMTKNGHVYFSIGRCGDGSVLLLHASPPAPSFCGTVTPDGREDSEAVRLAREYMTRHYPDVMKRYPNMCMRKVEYLKEYSQYRWDRKVVSDPDGLEGMTPEEILKELFK
jgi:hypothetical protein